MKDRKYKLWIGVLAAIAVVLGAGVFFFRGGSNTVPVVESLVQEETEIPVTVPVISTEEPTEASFEPETVQETETQTELVVDETMAEKTVYAEVVPSTTKSSENKTRNPEAATPPAETPANSESAAVPVENPDENGECQPENTQPAEQPQGGDTNSSGAVYVPGFGYVENSGPNTVESAGSGDGNWDRQIGSME